MMGVLHDHFSCVQEFWRKGLKKRAFAMAVVLVASALLGYFASVSNPEITDAVVEYFAAVMAESGAVSAAGTISAVDLLWNNWMAILLCVVYGFVPFLFLPILVLCSNAYLMGVVGAYYRIHSFPMPVFFAGILPHGIFELSALVLAAAMGLSLCSAVIKKLFRAPGAPPIKELVSDVLRTLLLIALPLLVCAALVEAYVTPWIMAYFLP